LQFTPKQPFVGIKLQLFNNPGFIEKTGLVPIRPALLPLQKKQLDHQEKSQVRRAYLRSDFMVQRKKMMQWFADWCEEQPHTQKAPNVVSIRGGK